MKSKKSGAEFSARDMILCALFAALTAVMAQIYVPGPGGVPVTMQTFAVLSAGIVLGAKRGFAAMAVYLLLGAAGLPVFAGFSGGLQKFAGPAGGFLASFPLMAFIAGLSAEPNLRARVARPRAVPFKVKTGKREQGRILLPLCAVLAIAANYACGAAYFCALTGAGMAKAATACVLPFILPDLLKAAGAVWAGIAVGASAGQRNRQF